MVSKVDMATIYHTGNGSVLFHGLANNANVIGMPSLTVHEGDYYFYEYEYDADPGNIPLEQLLPVSLVYGLTLVLGLLGNILVIISVAKFKKMQNVTNMYLLSLASADLLLVLICVPVKVVKCLCL